MNDPKYRDGMEAEDMADAADRWLSGTALCTLDERSTFGRALPPTAAYRFTKGHQLGELR